MYLFLEQFKQYYYIIYYYIILYFIKHNII